MTPQTSLAAHRRSPLEVAWRWTRENLFSSPANALLTLLAGLLIGFALYGVLRFVFAIADWQVVETNRRLYFLGRFPKEEIWRVWVIVYTLAGLGGLSVGLWTRIRWPLVALFGVGMVPVFLFIGGGEVALLTLGTIAVFAAGYSVAYLGLARQRWLSLTRSLIVWAWLALFVVWIYLLNAVDSLLWGGLLLTLILSVVGIVAAFPLGVLLALGRASTFPAIRLFCTVYIEIIRGVPLITVLFMALFFLPLMLEPERTVIGVPITGIELDLVLRATVAITLFSAAYLAENVRGGLQAVPRGQVEAAQALGLSTPRMLLLIVLPQALRAVIPALVGQFISLFKDTSLVFIMGLTELLAVARQVTAQPAFLGTQAESLLFIALIYWIVAFSMSRASQQLERNLGVGER